MNFKKFAVYFVMFIAIATGISFLIHMLEGNFFWYVIAGQWAEIIADRTAGLV